jgi:hypothetical protein
MGVLNMSRKKILTEQEFESLLTKASQPLQKVKQEQIHDSKEVQTSKSLTSGDCNESHTHPDNLVGT